jgi:uncharacterized protein (DUF1330 family)
VSAYIVALIDIKHPVQYEHYSEAFDFENCATEYGGEILMVSDEPEAIEGEWSGRLGVLRFPSRDKARGWYDSPEYRYVRTIRWAHSTTNLALHLGIDQAAADGAVAAEGTARQ